MTRLTPRLRWRQAVASEAFPRFERVVRGTLLCLVDLMSPTGDLEVWRDELVKATGLPSRTLNRHLQRAVELGWLVREKEGGNGRRSVYQAHVPDDRCEPKVAHNSGSSEPLTRTQLPEVVSHLVAQSIKESANDSERVAVHSHRGRRSTPIGSGVSATDYIRNSSTYKGWLPTPVDAACPDPTGEVA